MKKLSSFSTLFLAIFLIYTPVNATPKAGTVYKDWVMSCQPIPKMNKQHCHIAQTASNPKTNQYVLHTMIGRIVGQNIPIVVFIIPKMLGKGAKLTLAFGPKMAIDFKVANCDKKTKTCSAALPLDAQIKKAFKKGKVAYLIYKQGKKDVKIPISLLGITAGLKALPKK